uniref:Large ribosomal subunit protein uL18m n=1 Tax=Xenopsylla cheopis TaxID=163159 RepID=A0A6M2DS71_XENCH
MFKTTFAQAIRNNSTNAALVNTFFYNRNPRNLERLRIGYKPDGWHVDNPGRSFWNKLQLTETARYLTARVVHWKEGTVLEASTSEWAIKKHLYRPKDISAYANLGKVFAQRCIEFGLSEMYCDLQAAPNGKIDKFLKSVEAGGVILQEPSRFKKAQPWDADRPEKPWEVTE